MKHDETPGERIKTVWPDAPPPGLIILWDELRDTRVFKQFYAACADLGIYFDNYVTHRGGMSCRVYTEQPNARMPNIKDLIYLTRGEGHDGVSCSISGLRRSGRSSVKAWSAALQMQIEQLAGMLNNG